MKEIIKDNMILARHIQRNDVKEGLNFFSRDGEYIQIGEWNYPKGKKLLPHIHNEVERTINRTYEVLYVINGTIMATIYDLDGDKVDVLTITEDEILILLESGHGYEVLEGDTRVLEVKNGPYLGAEMDRRRLKEEN